jgi:hypothetical protein
MENENQPVAEDQQVVVVEEGTLPEGAVKEEVIVVEGDTDGSEETATEAEVSADSEQAESADVPA